MNIYFGHGSAHSPASLKTNAHGSRRSAWGRVVNELFYDSVVKYLLRSCRGRCVEKCACQNQENSEEMPEVA